MKFVLLLAKLQRLENIENTPKKVSEKPKNEPRMTKAARKRRRRESTFRISNLFN